MHKITTVQMVQWLSSVSANQCQMHAPVQIPPGSNFFLGLGLVVYIHVGFRFNISEFKFGMGCVPISIAKPL